MSGILAALAGIKTAIATAVDEYFNRTTLLLNTSSTNGAQNNTFLDSSTNNFTITRNGNTTQGTFTPFSQTGWSNYFNGSSDYLTAPANAVFDFSSGDFTVEAWVNPTTSGTERAIISKWNNSGATQSWLLELNSSNIPLFYYSTTGSDLPVLTGTTAISANTWTHIAVTRSGNTWTIWVNGVSSVSSTITSTIYTASATTVNIGRYYGAASYAYWPGYISNARVVKGTAVYTSAFTPPTTPLTAISGTSLLTCQSNRFFDSSTNAFALTASGTPSVQAFSPFAPTAAYSTSVVGGSGYFDGSGDYLSVASNAAFTFTGDFTWEGWFYMTANPSKSYSARLIDYNGGSNLLVFSTSDGTDYLGFAVGGTTYTTTTGLPRNQWAHVAVSRSGTGSNNLKLFLNGTAISTQTNTSTVTATDIYISNRPGSDGYFTGYIGSYRMTNTGLYTTTFTPATSPFTAVTGTALLLNYTNSGIFDSTAKNVLETVGNAQVSTTQAKFGTTSMAFDGTGDYLKLPSNTLYTFGTGAYTIEFWIYPNSLAAGTYHVVGANATNGIIIAINNAKIALNKYGVGDVLAYNTALTTSTWTHVAIVREGTGTNQTKIYVNGTSVATGTDTNDWTVTTNFGVGANTSDGSQGINAYLDDLRITKGYARYTSNFTAPTAAFPLL